MFNNNENQEINNSGITDSNYFNNMPYFPMQKGTQLFVS